MRIKKDVDALVSAIKVGDIVMFNNNTAYMVTMTSRYNKRLEKIALNNVPVDVKEIEGKIFALYRAHGLNEYYLFGDLDYRDEVQS